MKDMARLLEKWQLNGGDVREQMYRAPTHRERERWHGLWLLVQGWSVTQVAEALERDSHTIGDSLSSFRRAGAQGLVFEHTGGSPPERRATRPTEVDFSLDAWKSTDATSFFLGTSREPPMWERAAPGKDNREEP